ncbi:PAS domain-containing protein [Maribacter sp. 2210JD10-5]|uniref:PAS domain-containing protein n=1 Tax=Maribacter sp. 2210JD10-5 TaxID=3386272 RepID=UPI0039BD1368
MIYTKNKLSFSSDWIQQIPSAIALIDADFNFVSASPNWLKKFNFESTDLSGTNLFELFPRFSQDWNTRLKYSLDGLKDIKVIDRPENPKNRAENYVWNLNPWKDGYGNIIGVILKVENLSKTKELELELNKAKNLLNEKGKIAKIGSWELNTADRDLKWTPAVNDIYGVSKDFTPTIDEVFNFYKEGTSRKIISKVVEEAISTGKPWNENLQLVKATGEEIWVNSIGRPKFKDGICVRVIGTIQNITDTIDIKAKTVKKELPSNPYFDNVPFGLALINLNSGKILDINKSFLELTGFEKSHFKDKSFKSFINPSIKKRSKQLLNELKKANGFGELEMPFAHKNKKRLILKFSGKLLEKENNQLNVLVTLEDITSLVQKEKSLKKVLGRSKEQNGELLNFAHMVSHNLKAHATNFSLLLNFLDKENGENERQKLMDMLFNASDNLTDTIKGLREVVAIKTNINEEKRLLSLNDTVFHVEQNLIGLLKQNNGRIINEIPDTVKVKALPAYLESILTNCLTNAIKYRKKDKDPIIILNIEETKDYTILNIEDNGLGINMEKFGDKLFGLYKTFHKNKDARGIGLYITKNQIEAMNGKISATSIVNQGTTFKIYFNKL